MFKKIAVIGSGVMGAGIAAQIANAGFEVLLYDMALENKEDKNFLSNKALEKLALTSDNSLMHPSFIHQIKPCNLDTDLDLLKDVDWIIEVIIEKIDAKHSLYKKISPYLKENCLVSSNTSTIPLEKLLHGMESSLTERFIITHFFNPPRYMRLLELITSKNTRKDLVDLVTNFCDVFLGKGVIKCNDRPGFIANRIGCFWLEVGLKEALNLKIDLSMADLAMSKEGMPKTGIFGLMDLIGIDLMRLISDSLAAGLEKPDYFNKIYTRSEIISKMIQDNYLGRKSKSGFYRMDIRDGKKIKQVLNLENYQYIDEQSMENKEIGEKYTKEVMWQLLYYCLMLVPEICDDIYQIDKAMKLGFNWKYGPFELIDQMGSEFIIQNINKHQLPMPDLLKAIGSAKFYQENNGTDLYFGTDGKYHQINDNHLKLADFKKNKDNLLYSNNSLSLWNIGDDITCLEITSKMQILNLEILSSIKDVIDLVAKNFKAMIIGSDGNNFSAGADLKYIHSLIEKNQIEKIGNFIQIGQKAMESIKYAPFPIIAAVSGLALGGGAEILLHVHKIQAHSESYIGLVETSVGLIPGFGGCKELLLKYHNNKDGKISLDEIMNNLMKANISKSATHAIDMFMLGEHMSITMNKDRLLGDAKNLAISLVENYKITKARSLPKKLFNVDPDKYSGHELIIANYLHEIFNSKIIETELYLKEQESFIGLCKTEEVAKRIAAKLNM